jgi:hypothetical protein
MDKVTRAGYGVLVTGLMMLVQWQFFNTPHSGTILDLEFARTYDAAKTATAKWQTGAVIFNTVLDYAFLLAYGVFFFVALQRLSKVLTGVWAQAGSILKWFGPIAAICDGVENFMMLLFLMGPAGPETFASPFAWAVVKFALLGVALLYYFIGSNINTDKAFAAKK